MIPARFAPILFALLPSGMMSFCIAGIATLRTLGAAPGLAAAWLGAWAASWPVAFPLVLVLAPLTRRLVARLVRA